MTPEDIVAKYKKNVIQHLPNDDAEFIEAYVNMEVEKRTSRLKRQFTRLDALGGMLFIAGIAIALISFCIFIYNFCIFVYNEDSYVQGYNTAVEEQSHIIQKYKDDYRAELDARISALEAQNQSLLKAKKEFCTEKEQSK